jgi:hypothetical protein
VLSALPVLPELLDVGAVVVKTAVVDAEAPAEGPAVIVTGKKVISLWLRLNVEVPGKLAPVPLIMTVQTAEEVPSIEQISRP